MGQWTTGRNVSRGAGACAARFAAHANGRHFLWPRPIQPESRTFERTTRTLASTFSNAVNVGDDSVMLTDYYLLQQKYRRDEKKTGSLGVVKFDTVLTGAASTQKALVFGGRLVAVIRLLFV